MNRKQRRTAISLARRGKAQHLVNLGYPQDFVDFMKRHWEHLK